MKETSQYHTEQSMQTRRVIPLRNITEVLAAQIQIMDDPENLALSPCIIIDEEGTENRCQYYRPDLQIPCEKYLDGMSEVWPLGMHCMDSRQEIVLMDLSQPSEIEA